MSGNMMDFSEALKALKMGNTMTRNGWNGNSKAIELQTPDENSKMRRPYLYETKDGGPVVPWLPTQADLMAEDWMPVL